MTKGVVFHLRKGSFEQMKGFGKFETIKQPWKVLFPGGYLFNFAKRQGISFIAPFQVFIF